MYAQTRSTIFCDRFYVQTDVFEGKFCAMPNAIKNQYIKQIKVLVKFLMVISITQNQHSISLSFTSFQILNFIDFVTWTLTWNEVHHV